MGKLVTPFFVDSMITAETQPMTKARKYGLVVADYLARHPVVCLALAAGVGGLAGLIALLMVLIVFGLH
jgi:hypothetical protein